LFKKNGKREKVLILKSSMKKSFKIGSFKEFLLLEELHINRDIERISDWIYEEVIKSKENKITLYPDQKVFNLPVEKIIIFLTDGSYDGALDVGSSSKKDSTSLWTLTIHIDKNFKKYETKATIFHEMSHALRLMKVPKIEYLNNLNFKKSASVSFPRNKEFEDISNYIYLSNKEEIESMVSETYGFIKDFMEKNNVEYLERDFFERIIRVSRSYNVSLYLSEFSAGEYFKNVPKEMVDYFFSLFEKEKEELDIINKGTFFRKIRLFIRITKKLLSSPNTYIPPDYIKPKKGIEFYERYFHEAGEELRRKLFSLYLHFKKQ
jgi:hypothetical protein